MGHMKHGKTDITKVLNKAAADKDYGSAQSNAAVLAGLFTQSPIYTGDYTDEKVDALGNEMVTTGIGADKEQAKVAFGDDLISFGYEGAPDITKVKSGGVNQPSSPYTPNLGSPDADGNQPVTPKELVEELAEKAVKASTQNALNPAQTSSQIAGAATAPAGNLLFGQRPGSKPEDNYIKTL